MKRMKLISSLSTLAVIGTSIPIVSTSCSGERYSFDGYYSIAEVLSEEWIMKHLSINGNAWNAPEKDLESGGYKDTNAIEYLQQNIDSAKMYINFLIFSTAVEIFNNNEYDVDDLRFVNSYLIYNNLDKTFTFSYELWIGATVDECFPYISLRSKSSKPLKIVSVAQLSSERIHESTKLFTFAASAKEDTYDYGTEMKLFDKNSVKWSSWQDLSALNNSTKNQLENFSTLYVPNIIAPDANFKLVSGTAEATPIYPTYSEESIPLNETKTLYQRVNENYLYSLSFRLNNMYAFADEMVSVTVPESAKSKLKFICGTTDMALIATNTITEPITINIKVYFHAFAEEQEFNVKFATVVLDN